MPVLSPHLLSNHRELRLAHLALGFISMGYVWQEGQHAPAQVMSWNIAKNYIHCSVTYEKCPYIYIPTKVAMIGWKLLMEINRNKWK